MVTNVEQQKNTLEITLEKGADPQELLKAIVGKVRVRKFEVKMPSLHEIFVELVGACNPPRFASSPTAASQSEAGGRSA